MSASTAFEEKVSVVDPNGLAKISYTIMRRGGSA
jgi:hypothetical protein